MEYYYRNNLQQEEGPLPEEILREWLKLGQINESTYVRRCDSGVWMSAADAFCAPKGPAVLLSPAPSVPAEPSASPLNNVKARFIGGAVLALLVFIAYQKSQRGKNLIPQQPVATQPQQQQTGANLEESHQLVRIGLAHLYGVQCPVNMNTAGQCFSKAAEQEDACGLYWLTAVLSDDEDDDDETLKELEVAKKECAQLANQGDRLAMLCIGFEGLCAGEQDAKQKGMQLLSVLIEEGDPIAATELARFLTYDEANPKAQQQGFAFLQKLSADGIVRADRYLAYCYWLGLGTAKDSEKAVALMTRAAEKGDPGAIGFIKRIEQ